MSTWGSLLADIRVDLKDTATTQRWTDGALFLYTKDAIRNYSIYFPRYMSRVALTAANGSFPLPSDFLAVVDIESVYGTYLEQRMSRPGSRYTTSLRLTSYYIEGSYIYINVTPSNGSIIYLSYQAWHGVPATALDTTYTLTVPATDDELIRLFVRAKAQEQIRGQQANLDRFKLGSGDRQDNPLEPETNNLFAEYYRRIADRKAGGSIRLYRPGRNR